MGLTILLVLINNPDSIAPGGTDPRFSTLLSVGHELKRRGHSVIVEGAGALSSTSKNRAKRVARGAAVLERSFTWLSADALVQHGAPTLVISWFNFMRDRATRGKNQRVAKLLSDPNVTHLLYENGMARGTITVDPKGFLGDSFYRQSLNEQVQRAHDKTSCSAHIQEHLRQDSSKRPQLRQLDIPSTIVGRFVFVPTQKFADLSVEKYASLSYPQMLANATRFCKERRLPLVIKVHPHLIGEERAGQQALIRTLQAQHADVYESRSSINLLAARALFTATLNGGTLMDNFYTTSPVLALARGFFHNTEAVVYDTDVLRGMERMLSRELPWSETRKLRQRQVVWCRRRASNQQASPVGEQPAPSRAGEKS